MASRSLFSCTARSSFQTPEFANPSKQVPLAPVAFPDLYATNQSTTPSQPSLLKQPISSSSSTKPSTQTTLQEPNLYTPIPILPDQPSYQTLQKEIQELRTKLSRKEIDYQTALESTRDLQLKYMDAVQALEQGTEEFQLYSTHMQQAVEEETNRTATLQQQLNQTQDLVHNIQTQHAKLAEMVQSWKQAQQELDQSHQLEMDALRQEKSDAIANSQQQQLHQQQVFEEQKAKLQQWIDQETKTVQELQQQMEAESARHNTSKLEWEQALYAEQDKVRRLQQQLFEQQSKHNVTVLQLSEQLSQAIEAMSQAEQEMEARRLQYETMQTQLERELQQEKELGRRKKREMGERYMSIREHLTSRWEGAKRQARWEEARLRERHASEVQAFQKMVENLQLELNATQGNNKALEGDLSKLQAQVETLLSEKVEMEHRHSVALSRLRAHVGNLETSNANLESEVEEQVSRSEKQDEALKELETSFQALGKVSVKLTRNKMQSLQEFFKKVQNRLQTTVEGTNVDDETKQTRRRGLVYFLIYSVGILFY
eukprot:Nitzschia sp. Nitz4//scaffold1_size375055//365311//366939//NITZ4_000344-RA/size375055-processed-gene-0.398-mRNA-1//1//CDS//3329541249//8948//frame0